MPVSTGFRMQVRMVLPLAALLWMIWLAAGVLSPNRDIWFGFDFKLYFAQSLAQESGSAALYGGREFVPYPPLFAWLFTPFTFMTAGKALAIWTAINMIAVWHLVRRASLICPGLPIWPLTTLLVAAFPVALCLWTGQVQILLACAFAEFVVSMYRGRPLVAGLWLSLMILKPPYIALLVLCLLWKQHWRVLLGCMLGGAGIALLSILTVGWSATMVDYPRALMSMALDHGVSERMANWRSLGWAFSAYFGVGVSDFLATFASIATIVAALAVQRGPWGPDDTRFPTKLCVLLVGSQLSGFHSHAYGPALFVFPLLIWMARDSDVTGRVLLTLGLTIPVLAVIPPTPLHFRLAALLLACMLILFMGHLLRTLWHPQKSGASTPDPMATLGAGAR